MSVATVLEVFAVPDVELVNVEEGNHCVAANQEDAGAHEHVVGKDLQVVHADGGGRYAAANGEGGKAYANVLVKGLEVGVADGGGHCALPAANVEGSGMLRQNREVVCIDMARWPTPAANSVGGDHESHIDDDDVVGVANEDGVRARGIPSASIHRT